MRGKDVVLVLAAFAMSFPGCNQYPKISPRLSRVVPRKLIPGQKGFLLVDGENFLPSLSWSSQSGEPLADYEIEISFDGQPFSSEGVDVLTPTRLAVRIPPGLEAGWHSVSVKLPGGGTDGLENAFFVDGNGFEQRISSCPQESPALYPDSYGLCNVVPGSEEGTLEFEPIVERAIGLYSDGEELWPVGGWQKAFTVSPTDDIIGFLRLEHGAPPRLQLLFKHIPSGTEWLADELEVPGADPDRLDVLNDIINEGLLKDTLSAPAFSPDGSVFAYVREGSTLVAGAIDRSNGEVLFANPIATFPEQDGLMHKLYQPSIDAANAYVLVTDIGYVFHFNEQTEKLERVLVAMKPVLVSLADGSKKVLFENDDQYLDGPAVFIPGSRDILFASTRLGLNIMTPFGTVAPAIRLFLTNISGSEIRSLESHDAMFLFGPLSVSPDGALASMAGMVSTDASGADLIVFDLSSGNTISLGRDPLPFCFPFAGEARCRMSSFKTEQGEDIFIVSCCQPEDEGGACCDFDTPLPCSSWEVLPSFSATDILTASSLSIVWICADGGGAFTPASAGMNMLFASVKEDGTVGYEYIISSLGTPLIPDFRTIARLPDGAGQ